VVLREVYLAERAVGVRAPEEPARHGREELTRSTCSLQVLQQLREVELDGAICDRERSIAGGIQDRGKRTRHTPDEKGQVLVKARR